MTNDSFNLVLLVICDWLGLPPCQHGHMLQHCGVSLRIHSTGPCFLSTPIHHSSLSADQQRTYILSSHRLQRVADLRLS